MASGCLPVAGDMESIREWISQGVNGLLCDPTSAESTAGAILHALRDSELRRRAAAYNVALVSERAEYRQTMAKAESFYQEILSRYSRGGKNGNVDTHL